MGLIFTQNRAMDYMVIYILVLGSFIYYEIRDILLTSCLLTILERMQTMGKIQRLREESSWRKDELIYLFMYIIPFQKVM